MKAGMVEGRERGVANAGGGAARRGRSRLEATVDMGDEGMSCIEGYGLESVARRQAGGVGWSEGNGLVVRSPLPISGREKARAWEAGGALVGGVCRGMRKVAKKIRAPLTYLTTHPRVPLNKSVRHSLTRSVTMN